MSTGDKIYRTVFSTIKFFSKGWGPIETAESLARVMTGINQESCQQTIKEHSHPITLKKMADNSEGTLYEGTFISPLATLLPGVLPVESESARFELLLPKEWKSSTGKPIYIHMAGTGDHYYWRRRYLFAFPLLKSGGMGSLILENPYYGTRKPRNQSRSQLHYVTDLFVMGLALIHESMVLSNWLEEEKGLGPVGLTGISMGGHNCSLSASLWPKPVPAVPCLSLVTASPVFTQGAFKTAVSWEELERQLIACRLGQDERRRRVFDIILSRYGQPDLLSLMDSYDEKGQSSKVKRSNNTPKPVTLQIMKHVLDYSTHFHNYPNPVSPDLITFLPAKHDLYMPHDTVEDFREVWPGCNVNYIDGGHVTSFLLQRRLIVKTQIELMDRFLCSQSVGNRNETLACGDA